MTENNAGDKKLEQRVPAEIVAKIEQEVPDLKSAPRELRGKIVEGVIKVTQELYEGPIPHPSIAAAWNDLVPDAAERMLRMAEKDQDATIENVRDVNRRDDRIRILTWLGSVSTIIILYILSYLVVDKSLSLALAFLSVGSLGIIIALLKLAGQLNGQQSTPSQETAPSKDANKSRSAKRR